MLAANAGGVAGLVPGAQPVACGLLAASTAFGLVGSGLGIAGSSKPGPSAMSKVKELQESFNNNIRQLVSDINKQNKILKGCIERLHSWTEQKINSLQRDQVYNYLQPLLLDAHNGVSSSFTFRSLSSLANHYSREMMACKRITNTLSIIGNEKNKIEQAVAMLSAADEYMNICNQFAVGFQLAHNMGEDNQLKANFKIQGLTLRAVEPTREHGFDLVSQVFSHFAGYFATLEVKVMAQKITDAWNVKKIVKSFKYKAQTLRREWSWVKSHHKAGKKWPARASPRGNQCKYWEYSKPICRVCLGSGRSFGCYEKVSGTRVDGRAVSYSTSTGYEQCYREGGVFYPTGVFSGDIMCHHKGISGYNGATGEWAVPHHALRGTAQDPSQNGCSPPWHAQCR